MGGGRGGGKGRRGGGRFELPTSEDGLPARGEGFRLLRVLCGGRGAEGKGFEVKEVIEVEEERVVVAAHLAFDREVVEEKV
jgi:hypothetical protein